MILRPREGEALSEGAAVCTWNGKQKGSRLVLVGVEGGGHSRSRQGQRGKSQRVCKGRERAKENEVAAKAGGTGEGDGGQVTGVAAIPGQVGQVTAENCGTNPTSGGREHSHLGAREPAGWETPGAPHCLCSHL